MHYCLNYLVLRGYNPVGKTTIRGQLLKAQAFNFDFYTHTFRTKGGMVYYFCYEYGYSFIEEDKVVLVTWQSYMNRNVNEVMGKGWISSHYFLSITCRIKNV